MRRSEGAKGAGRPLSAAQYLRASTGLQACSLETQRDAIAAYAAERGVEIVATFSDAGRSGLDLDGRPALKALLATALGPAPPFQVILVHDVSRWGRFQDLDEGAHYEFLCRCAGIGVAYCAESFENDGSPEAVILKALKRTAAAEYSRALSVRVAAAKRRVAGGGFLCGGPAPFGYRRQVVTEAGRAVCTLERGERKAQTGYRTRLVIGPPEEAALVRRIFRLWVVTGLKVEAIAARLREEGAVASGPGGWTRHKVRRILKDPAYVGELVFGKSRWRLLRKLEPPPRDRWIRRPGAWPPLVDQARYDQAQALLRFRGARSDQTALDELAALWTARGRLDTGLIDAAPGLLSASGYAKRFGSLGEAYRRIGYRPRALRV